MPARTLRAVLLCLALGALSISPLFAQGNPAFQLYNVGRYEGLSIKAITSRTSIEGPIARTRLTFVAANPYQEQIEVGFTLTVPPGFRAGRSMVSVVLLDGAHNRTEIAVDLLVE